MQTFLICCYFYGLFKGLLRFFYNSKLFRSSYRKKNGSKLKYGWNINGLRAKKISRDNPQTCQYLNMNMLCVDILSRWKVLDKGGERSVCITTALWQSRWARGCRGERGLNVWPLYLDSIYHKCHGRDKSFMTVQRPRSTALADGNESSMGLGQREYAMPIPVSVQMCTHDSPNSPKWEVTQLQHIRTYSSKIVAMSPSPTPINLKILILIVAIDQLINYVLLYSILCTIILNSHRCFKLSKCNINSRCFIIFVRGSMTKIYSLRVLVK